MADFKKIFAKNGALEPITDVAYEGGWVDIVGSNPPETDDFNSVMNEQDTKINEIARYGIVNWDIGIAYAAGAWARSTVDNAVYELLPGGDSTNEPSASPADWVQFSTELSEADKVELKSGRKNVIINGNFDIWQRGTNQTSTGYGSDDRWENDNQTSTKVHTRESFSLGQTDVPNNPKYFSRTVVTSIAGSNSAVTKEQKIKDVSIFSGETATLSFWAKADSNKSIATELVQQFGTGGSPSSNVTGIGVTTHNLTTSWQKFTVSIAVPSVSGRALGTNDNDSLQLFFWFDAGSDFDARTNSLGQQSGTFDIAQVQLEKGSFATDFERLPIDQTFDDCLSYYWQPPEGREYLGAGYFFTANDVYFGVDFPKKMRANPSLIVFNSTNVIYERAGSSNGNMIGLVLTSATNYSALIESSSISGSGSIGNGTRIFTDISGQSIAFSAEI